MNALLAAARPLVRDFSRTPWRILVAIILIAIPTAFFSYQVTQEAPTRHATVSSIHPTTVRYPGGKCQQAPDGSAYSCEEVFGYENTTLSEGTAALEQALPEGMKAEPYGWMNMPVAAHGRSLQAHLRVVPETLLPRGVPVPEAGQIVLSSNDADSLKIQAGDELEATTPAGKETLEVIAISPAYEGYSTDLELISEGTVEREARNSSVEWVIHHDRPMTWDDVLALNHAGFVASSADVTKNPPPAEQIPAEFHRDDRGRETGLQALFLLFYLGFFAMITIIILLLISPVFTIALGRHSQIFALMASQGASRRQIRRAVLLTGMLLGVVGSTLGVLSGCITGTVKHFIDYPGWPLGNPWPVLAFLWLVGVLGSVALAFVPAIVAARQAISTAILGGVPDKMLRWRPWMAIGPVGLVIVLLAAIYAFLINPSARLAWVFDGQLLFLGAFFTLLLSVPTMVFGVCALTQRLSLPLRLAGRQLTRKALHSIPAISALLAVSFVAALMNANTVTGQRQAAASELSITNHAMITVTSNGHRSMDESAASIEEEVALELAATLGNAKVIELKGLDQNDPARWDVSVYLTDYPACAPASDSAQGPGGTPAFYVNHENLSAAEDPQAAHDCLSTLAHQHIYSPILGPSAVLVQEPKDLDMWVMDEPTRRQAEIVLAQGGVLLAKGSGLDQPAMTKISVARQDDEESSEVLAFEALPPGAGYTLVLSPIAAHQIGLQTTRIGYAVEVPDHLSMKQRQAALDQILASPAAKEDFVRINSSNSPNYRNHWILAGFYGGISLVVLILVLALSAAGIRRDSRVLQSIGAAPRLTAAVNAWHMGLISLLGLGGGVLAGHLASWMASTPAETTINGDTFELGTRAFWQPSWPVILAALGVTVLSSAVAWALARRKEDDLTQPRD